MSVPEPVSPSARSLPTKPNLAFLKNEAKQRLRSQRTAAPAAKLAEMQHQLAREYGFANWRELKAKVERVAEPELSPVGRVAIGDWIGFMPANSRVGLHLRAAGGALSATLDAWEVGQFGLAADYVSLEGDWLSFTLLMPSPQGVQQGFYQARWDAGSERWIGAWTMHGITTDLDFVRGAFAPAPRFDGLDGFWDGRLQSVDRLVRIIIRFKTGDHGTFAWLDSPDTGLLGRPAVAIAREGRDITITMKTVVITGVLSADGQWIEGLFLKGETRRALTLVRRPPGGAPPLPQRAPEIELSSEALAAFAGDYLSEFKSVVRISLEGGRLHIQFVGPVTDDPAEPSAVEAVRGPKLELLPSSPTKFFWRILDATAEFELGPDGRAVAMVTRQNGRRFRAVRVD